MHHTGCIPPYCNDARRDKFCVQFASSADIMNLFSAIIPDA